VPIEGNRSAAHTDHSPKPVVKGDIRPIEKAETENIHICGDSLPQIRKGPANVWVAWPWYAVKGDAQSPVGRSH